MLKNRFFFPLLATLFLFGSLVGCSAPVAESAPTEPVEPAIDEVHLMNPIGPLVIPIAGITSGNATGSISIAVQYWKTMDEAIGLLSGDDVEFAILPITTGVNIAASDVDIVLVGVHEWKVFYLVATDANRFSSWDSLIGSTIYTPEAKGQTVDVLTRYILTTEGITPDTDVTFAYAPAQEIVALFQEGKVDFAALPEPFVTQALASGKGEIVLDYQDEWSKISGSEAGIPIAGLFVKGDFAAQYPDETYEVARILSESTQWANDNPEAAIEAGSEVLPLPSEVMRAAMNRMKFGYIPASTVQEEVLGFLRTMQETYPEGIKSIPGDDFFIP
jgi:NitT/TauT family transport system substrate-binding protein